jgi:hypothetical protein
MRIEKAKYAIALDPLEVTAELAGMVQANLHQDFLCEEILSDLLIPPHMGTFGNLQIRLFLGDSHCLIFVSAVIGI